MMILMKKRVCRVDLTTNLIDKNDFITFLIFKIIILLLT